MLRFALTFVLAAVLHSFAAPIRVVVWDEQQPAQKQVYTNFLGNQIAQSLRGNPKLMVRSVNMNEPEQGLSADVLDNADVLIWWGHVRHAEVDKAKASNIVERIQAGKLSLIALHSAHWSEPFVQAMRARTLADAKRLVRPGAPLQIQTVTLQPFLVPKRDAPLTPSYSLVTNADGVLKLSITNPVCVFPAFRGDGAPSHVKVLMPEHPIARGVPAVFDIPHTEMYDEPFHVPKPDAVILEEHWDKGEHFRSGCVWDLGRGKVFYFRPGHETFDVYLQPNVLKLLSNAAEWLGAANLNK